MGKLSSYSAITPVLTDEVPAIDDPGGTPANGKFTLQVLLNLFKGTGDVATKTGTETLTNKTLTAPVATRVQNAQTGTTYTLALSDASKWITMTNGSANTVTIPTNASVAFPVGTEIEIWQGGAGVTTIAAASGVTLIGNGGAGDGYSADITVQYGAVMVRKQATDTWWIAGAIDTVAA